MSDRLLSDAGGGRNSRRILLVSLALNLFFFGIGGALLWRHYVSPSPTRAPGYWTAAARMDRLAATLPAIDAEKLRAEFSSRATAVDAASGIYRGAQQRLRAALQAEPFSLEDVKTAMAQSRAARQKLDEALQDVIASASAAMTPDGRRHLADWTAYRRTGNEKGR